jgi:hypothetical protein
MSTGIDHVAILDEHWVEIKQRLKVCDNLLAYLVKDNAITKGR